MPNSEMIDGLEVRRFQSQDKQTEYIITTHNDAEIMLQSPSTVGGLITGVLQ